MKIYTRTGDEGTTSLFGGRRVSKADGRVEAYGTLDEANSAIGLARSFGLDPMSKKVLEELQHDLFVIGAEVASGRNPEKKLSMPLIGASDVKRLEDAIDQFEQQLEPLSSFILPGGTSTACALHLTRTVLRRAERTLVALSETSPVRKEILEYVNRASDLLFVLARQANRFSGVSDVCWIPSTD